jgi:hypothetical protein
VEKKNDKLNFEITYANRDMNQYCSACSSVGQHIFDKAFLEKNNKIYFENSFQKICCDLFKVSISGLIPNTPSSVMFTGDISGQIFVIKICVLQRSAFLKTLSQT